MQEFTSLRIETEQKIFYLFISITNLLVYVAFALPMLPFQSEDMAGIKMITIRWVAAAAIIGDQEIGTLVSCCAHLVLLGSPGV